ncbi:MAG TPA: class II glutamine amidotransferase [Solirubrobacteraceae bacterium]|nr:class II glutamine amidotransferase [Solirubrobacteraceae bacterium]
MCRWMAWHGQPVLIDELLFKTKHSLIDQSLHSKLGAETTNGDGNGVGWYGGGDGPGVYRSISPGWADANLRHIAAHVESPLFLAHVRASSGTAVQQSNCHPFPHGRWLFVHNGLINDFHEIRRDMLLALDAQSVGEIEGSADSEVLFHLALGFGLEHDPIGGLEQAVGFAEQTLRDKGIAPALQTSIGVSDGEHLWAVRYSSEGKSRTLFRSRDAETIKGLHPGDARIDRLLDSDRIVVSEPLSELPGDWHEIPEATALTIAPGGAWETRPFAPRSPAAAS